MLFLWDLSPLRYSRKRLHAVVASAEWEDICVAVTRPVTCDTALKHIYVSLGREAVIAEGPQR